MIGRVLQTIDFQKMHVASQQRGNRPFAADALKNCRPPPTDNAAKIFIWKV
jgi:hypothetical protein